MNSSVDEIFGSVDDSILQVFLNPDGCSECLCKLNVAYRSNIIGEPVRFGSNFTIEFRGMSSFLTVGVEQPLAPDQSTPPCFKVPKQIYSKNTYQMNAAPDPFKFQFTNFKDIGT